MSGNSRNTYMPQLGIEVVPGGDPCPQLPLAAASKVHDSYCLGDYIWKF